MVSKVAVIAIVAILAVPILLGYAMNVEQVTETDYKTTGDTVNVTPLLQNGTGYTMANADVYQINSTTSPFKPIYNTQSYQKTSMPVEQYVYDGLHGQGNPGDYPHAQFPLNTYVYMYLQSNITNTSTGYLNFTLYDLNNAPLVTVNKILSVTWVLETSTIRVNYVNNSNLPTWTTITVADSNQVYGFSDTGNYTATGYLTRLRADGVSNYADISGGSSFIQNNSSFNSSVGPITVSMPDKTHSMLYTLNLDSITDSNYTIAIGGFPPYILQKTTTDGVVSWKVTTWSTWNYPHDEGIDGPSDPDVEFDLYYDPSRSDNTYQIKQSIDYGSFSDGAYHNKQKLEFNYVGGWPSTIGQANYYWSYIHENDFISTTWNTFNLNLKFNALSYYRYLPAATHTPTVRVDSALFRAFEYPLIADKTYDPAGFKTNPSTTIDNINSYGSSLTFGGNTYSVSNGNITMGTHEIPVKGLVLSSVPNPNGGYDNKIGNTVISTTAAPSAITFNGKWSASITTTAQEEYQVTKTEWKAGDFAWDGMDQNFLMVGLLASLGAFIALGIYARRSRASVWPLLIVCGGAALLFFIML